MKNTLLFFGLLLSGVTTQAQGTLSLTEFGFDHAYCRLFGYQTGNGVVYAAASGGVPDYTYLWTNLSTGEEYPNSTWGGLSPAHYEITVTDSEGNVLKDTIFLDSLNPVADFAVSGAGVSELDWGYIGTAPVEIQYENTSLYYANPMNPLSDTTFYFRPHGVSDWNIYHDYGFFEPYTFEYGGTYTAWLCAINKNGCADTIHKTIGLFGPAGLEDDSTGKYFSISSHSINQTIEIEQLGFDQGLDLNIYTLGGQKVLNVLVANHKETIPFDQSKGIYVYELRDHTTGVVVESGKINF